MKTIEEAEEVFSAKKNDAQAKAHKQCLALRPNNVRDAQIGWYSSVTFKAKANQGGSSFPRLLTPLSKISDTI